jgi:hypothetical protein
MKADIPQRKFGLQDWIDSMIKLLTEEGDQSIFKVVKCRLTENQYSNDKKSKEFVA